MYRSGKRILNEDQVSENALVTPVDTRWNSYFYMLDCVQKNKGAISVTQLDESLELGARQQLNPQDWEKITAILTILKPILYCTKAAEGDGVAISEVIPLN